MLSVPHLLCCFPRRPRFLGRIPRSKLMTLNIVQEGSGCMINGVYPIKHEPQHYVPARGDQIVQTWSDIYALADLAGKFMHETTQCCQHTDTHT